MLNKIIVMGRLTKDPEMRYTYSGIPVAGLSIAVDRNYTRGKDKQRETDFFNVVAWQGRAEFACKHFGKGQLVCIEGRMERRQWTDQKDGSTRYTYEIIAESIYFGGYNKGDVTNNGDAVSNVDAERPDSFNDYGGPNPQDYEPDFDPYSEETA